MASQQKRRAAAAQTGLYLLIIAAIVVVGNVLSAQWYSTADVTKDQIHSLSEGSKRMVRGLKADLTIEFYYTKGLAKVNVFVEDLKRLLKEYESAAPKKVKLTMVEPKTDEEKEQAEKEGLKPLNLVERGQKGNKASLAQGYMGIVLKYKSEKEVLEQVTPGWESGLEFLISSKIRVLRDKAEDSKPKIGLVTGKEELSIGDENLTARAGRQEGYSLKAVLTQWFPFYDLQDVEIKGEEPIDPSLSGLVVTQPSKDYTDQELRRLDEFLMRGNKALAVFASAANLKVADKDMKADLNLHNLDTLLRGYGLDLKKNLVLDWGAQFRIAVRDDQGQVAELPYAGIAEVIDDPRLTGDKQRLDATFPAFFRLDQVPFPFPSSIELLKDKQPKEVELKAVARTTPQSSLVTKESGIDLHPLEGSWSNEKREKLGQYVIAAVAEGPLKSAFAGSETPEGFEGKKQADKPSRVFLVGSGMFITNPFAYAGNGPKMNPKFQMFGNVGGDPQLQRLAQFYTQDNIRWLIMSFKNTLDWVSGDMDLLAVSNKLVGSPNLTYSTIDPPDFSKAETKEELEKINEEYREKQEEIQSTIQWTLTLGFPALFAAIGLLRWWARESGRAKRKM